TGIVRKIPRPFSDKPLMKSGLRIFTSIGMTLAAGAAAFAAGCSYLHHTSDEPAGLFAQEAPQNALFKQELDFLETKRLLLASERQFIEKQLTKVEDTLGVPKNLLWCVLFQESRFDPMKNAFEEDAFAHGIGQFTQAALDEVNLDTDTYDERTSYFLDTLVKPQALPLNFAIQVPHRRVRYGRVARPIPRQSKSSYYNTTTAIVASGTYLNNRYWQIRRALDAQGVSYDPDLLWLYAAAAYNKGARTIFVLLTQQFLDRGEKALSELLQNPKLTHFLLTRPDVLEHSLKDLWPSRMRKAYIEELSRNMEFISSCALPGTAL
ncbi:MAG: hypothetical protein ACXWP5_15830, partial [Bdellovibrionota bacterium]